MLSETIKSRLLERFNESLPEFHKRRIVFWQDDNGEFAEQADALSLPDITIIKLTGRNNFAVKKLLTADDLTGDYLIYNPLADDKPQDNWLLDIELYSGEPFRADLISMQMAELNIEPVSESCTAYGYQLVREWQCGEESDDLYEICRYVERELRLANRFEKMEIAPLLKNDTLPAINESIL